MKKREVICWDSSVLIDWIRGDDPSRIKDIRAVVESIKKNNYLLVVSTLVYVEVLEREMPGGAIDKFRSFLQNKNEIEIVAVDINVAEKAQIIRNHTSIKTPDAVHIATAIMSGAKFFHTFDKKLISFSGKNEVEKLAITPCTILGEPGNLSL